MLENLPCFQPHADKSKSKQNGIAAREETSCRPTYAGATPLVNADLWLLWVAHDSSVGRLVELRVLPSAA